MSKYTNLCAATAHQLTVIQFLTSLFLPRTNRNELQAPLTVWHVVGSVILEYPALLYLDKKYTHLHAVIKILLQYLL